MVSRSCSNNFPSIKCFSQEVLFSAQDAQPPPRAEERCCSTAPDPKEPWAFPRFSSLRGAILDNTASEGWRDTLWHNYSDGGRKLRGLYQRMSQTFAVLSTWLICWITGKLISAGTIIKKQHKKDTDKATFWLHSVPNGLLSVELKMQVRPVIPLFILALF